MLNDSQNYKKIIDAALKLAKEGGINNIKLSSIHKLTGIKKPNIYDYFLSIFHVKNEIVIYSIENEIIEIIVMAIAEKRITLESLSPKLKKKVKNYFA